MRIWAAAAADDDDDDNGDESILSQWQRTRKLAHSNPLTGEREEESRGEEGEDARGGGEGQGIAATSSWRGIQLADVQSSSKMVSFTRDV
eukprot:752691-Hanusia_phi.AAC.1